MQTDKRKSNTDDKQISSCLRLRPYQKEGVALIDQFVQRNGGCLLADEMGLGKTAQAINWLKKRKRHLPAIVICPANAKYVWEREIENWLGIVPVVLEGGRKQGRTIPRTKIIIINYDILESWAGYLRRHKFKSLVMDEVQYIANRSTSRYAGINRLVIHEVRKGKKKKRVTARLPLIPYRIGLSGTPIGNRPAELFGCLSILWPDRYVHPWSFYHKYCRPYRFRGRWIIGGAKNLKLLHSELVAQGMVRRFKKDELPEIPPKVRNIIPVEIRRREEYDYASDEFLKWLRKKSEEKALRASRAEAITRMTYLLRLAAKFKFRKTVKWIEKFRRKHPDKKLFVVSYISPLLKVLHRRYPESVLIDGSVRGRDRMEAVDIFQEDPECLYAFCNGKAAGVALTLHSAAHGLGTDFPWNPATLIQAEDRIHRFGQKKTVTFTYLLATGTIEEPVWKVICQKQEMLETVLNGRADNDAADFNRLNRTMFDSVIKKIMKKGSK